MTEQERERLVTLEGHMERVLADIDDLKSQQMAALEKQQEATLYSRDLKAELARAIDLLESHQVWHDKHDEKKYKITDIVMALGMLALGIFTAVRG